MIRNIAGIMADEEPKASISPSGSYNTSDFFSSPSDGVLSDVSLSGLGEFTFMCWVYLISPSSNITVYRESSSTLRPLYFLGSGSISVSFNNSNGGVTTLQYPYTREVNEWHHWTVTGSVSNGRLRLYKDGILVQSAVMTYANETSSSSRIDNDSYYLSQMNMFNRELSEAEVAEHYVYDDDTMTSGVLGFDAMTASQRNGLIYSSSYINTISRAGNEFTDKSGSNITLSPQPSLTGQQIYVYTDANDLPSNIHPVNSADLNGTDQYFDAGNPTELQITGSVTCAGWLKFDNSNKMSIMGKWGSITSLGGFYLGRSESTTGSLFWQPRINGGAPVFVELPVNNDQWYFVVAEYDGTTVSLEADRGTPITATAIGSLTINTGNSFHFGRNADNGSLYVEGGMYSPLVLNRVLTTQEKDTLYGNGTPPCFDNWPQSVKDDILISPELGNYNGNTGSETVDRSPNGITITNVNSTPFTGTGLTVECSN